MTRSLLLIAAMIAATGACNKQPPRQSLDTGACNTQTATQSSDYYLGYCDGTNCRERVYA
jgi:hypothetical protein